MAGSHLTPAVWFRHAASLPASATHAYRLSIPYLFVERHITAFCTRTVPPCHVRMPPATSAGRTHRSAGHIWPLHWLLHALLINPCQRCLCLSKGCPRSSPGAWRCAWLRNRGGGWAAVRRYARSAVNKRESSHRLRLLGVCCMFGRGGCSTHSPHAKLGLASL